MEDNIIVLEDENGNAIEFEVIDVYDFNGARYFAMLETVTEDGTDEDEVLIMKMQAGETDDDATLIMVEDDDELQAAFEEFIRRDEEDEE